MLLHLAAMILLSLHTAESQGHRRIQPKVGEIWASPGTEVTIPCRFPSWMKPSTSSTPWYKEEQNRSLRKIYHSSVFSKPSGKYSSPSDAQRYGSLTISNVQRNDSGVYYCVSPASKLVGGLQRTRLIVTGTSGASFSILAPASLPEDHLHHDVPLLCLVFDADPAWESVSWDIDGETSQVPKEVDMIDVNGVFNIWSLRLVPPKTWTQRALNGCSVQQNGSIRAGLSTNTGNCNPVLYFGVPCIIILFVILAVILQCRKHLARGKAESPASQVRMRESLQVDYAELRYNRQNVVETD
ncbi:immunoglobulin lambda-1 light chain-like isoform X1 [Paroedura picta]|uniref:immunoglobulin lambda-1 light chain-like isoform X1 n=1 Tax=Paroedura picta TaxID=143630 RepID=UPI0010142881